MFLDKITRQRSDEVRFPPFFSGPRRGVRFGGARATDISFPRTAAWAQVKWGPELTKCVGKLDGASISGKSVISKAFCRVIKRKIDVVNLNVSL